VEGIGGAKGCGKDVHQPWEGGYQGGNARALDEAAKVNIGDHGIRKGTVGQRDSMKVGRMLGNARRLREQRTLERDFRVVGAGYVGVLVDRNEVVVDVALKSEKICTMLRNSTTGYEDTPRLARPTVKTR
jgi:hypothetical protein